MKKHIYDEKTGISYTLQGDYYLPDIALPNEEQQPVGLWGQRHLRYIKQHRKVLYTNLLTSGKLNSYLVDIVAVLVDVAVIVDIGGIILIVAGRPQPPPAEPIQSNPRITSRRTIIVFCRCSSKHRANFDSQQFALKSARTVLEGYSLAP